MVGVRDARSEKGGGARWQHKRGKRQILVAHVWTWARLTAAAGITFVVLAVAGFVVRGVPPSPGEPLADARAYYVDHRIGVLTFVFLDCLAMFRLVAFAAGLGGSWRGAAVSRGASSPA